MAPLMKLPFGRSALLVHLHSARGTLPLGKAAFAPQVVKILLSSKADLDVKSNLVFQTDGFGLGGYEITSQIAITLIIFIVAHFLCT